MVFSGDFPGAGKVFCHSLRRRVPRAPFKEDVNGEKPTVKKWWIFGADFFTANSVSHGALRDISRVLSKYCFACGSLLRFRPIFSRFTPIFHGL